MEKTASIYMIPSQATFSASRLLQSIEITVPQSRIRYRIRDQQKEIARKSNGFVCVGPWLQIDCRRRYGAGEKEDESEGGD